MGPSRTAEPYHRPPARPPALTCCRRRSLQAALRALLAASRRGAVSRRVAGARGWVEAARESRASGGGGTQGLAARLGVWGCGSERPALRSQRRPARGSASSTVCVLGRNAVLLVLPSALNAAFAVYWPALQGPDSMFSGSPFQNLQCCGSVKDVGVRLKICVVSEVL